MPTSTKGAPVGSSARPIASTVSGETALQSANAGRAPDACIAPTTSAAKVVAAAGGTIDSTSRAAPTAASSEPTSSMPASAASRRDNAPRPSPAVTTRYPARTSAPPTALPMSPVPTTATVSSSAVITAYPSCCERTIRCDHSGRLRVRHSRRTVLSAGLGLAGATLLRARPSRAAEVTFADDPFTLGLASGYPEPNTVVLWTRLAPQPLVPGGGVPSAPVAVAWEVGTDEALRRVVRRGSVQATPDWAHSVHVEVAGLEPARDYWYRFTSGGARSPVGRTRTAAARGTLQNRLTLAVACCQHFEQGHYAAYRAIAEDAPDVVVHVGDYIYEGRGTSRVRTHEAPECHTLEDYRQRYAIYKSDPHLQAAHAAGPWLLVSDDHEVANDYAGEHSRTYEPPELLLRRRGAAYQAYYEHQPMPRMLRPVGSSQSLYTSRAFGDLAAIFMLDGRQYRSPQACQPLPLIACDELYGPERTMLGDEQEQWLRRSFAASTTRW